MKKIEAQTLEEAYAIACDEFGCSMTELRYEVVQYPSRGIMGLFAKPAIIVATAEKVEKPVAEAIEKEPESESKKETEKKADEAPSAQKPEASESGERRPEPVATTEPETLDEERSGGSTVHPSETKILEGFFTEEKSVEHPEEAVEKVQSEIQEEIEAKLKALMEKSCFEIDVVEVDVIDGTAYIFIDGEDAALIIGKEGYRYNALSYLLYNWLHGNYGLYVKLEVASFLSSQEEMIRNSLQSVIEHVEREGWGRTRPLDGILVQIALEQLREAFPDKYVAIKRHRDGKRYILINEFNKRR